MSGRLIILGKKGYCPWNAENLSRIRRDEQEHRETQEREQERQADKASILRLAALKKKGNSGESTQERFNLFESEEKAFLDRVDEVQGSRSETDERKNKERVIRNKNKKNHDEPHYQSHRFGGHSLTKSGKRKKFYLEPSSIEEPLGLREVRRHQERDPMREFHESEEAEKGILHPKEVQSKPSELKVENLDRRRKRRSSKRHKSGGDRSFERDDTYTKRTKGKHKKRKRCRRQKSYSDSHRRREEANAEKSSDRSSTSTVSMEELRRRRAEREQQERQRQDAILKTAKSLR